MKYDQLKQLGFSEKESAVYLAILELGETTVSKIAERSSINRTTLYDVLPSLVKRGLVSKSGGTKKETYAPQPPEKLLSMLELQASHLSSQIKIAKTFLPELKMINAKSSRPKVEMYDGRQGIKDLYELTLLAHEDIRSINSADELEAFDSEFMNDYYRRRTEKKKFAKGILSDTAMSRKYHSLDKKYCREIRLVPKEEMDIKPEVYIFDDQIMFFSLRESYGIRVTSSDIADAFKHLYDLAWKQAGNEKPSK